MAESPRPDILVPQQKRSRATQLRLLEATIECLVELGYANTTTTEIGRRAGVSQGALFKHFPSKQDLLAATIAHLFRGVIADFAASVEDLFQQPDRVKAAVARLWEVFESPALQAAYDLFTAGRTEPALSQALRPVLEAHRESYLGLARALFPEAAAKHPDFDAAVAVVIMAMQGTAMMRGVFRDDSHLRRELRLLERLARRELSTGTEEATS